MANIINGVISGNPTPIGFSPKLLFTDTKTYRLSDYLTTFPTSTSATAFKAATRNGLLSYNYNSKNLYLIVVIGNTQYIYPSNHTFSAGTPRYTRTYDFVLQGNLYPFEYNSSLLQRISLERVVHCYNNNATSIRYYPSSNSTSSSVSFIAGGSASMSRYGVYCGRQSFGFSTTDLTQYIPYEDTPSLYTRCHSTFCNGTTTADIDLSNTQLVWNINIYEIPNMTGNLLSYLLNDIKSIEDILGQ